MQNMPNQTFQTKPTTPNLPKLSYQTKPSKPNLPNQTCQTKPTKPNQNYCLRQLTPGSVVPLAMFYFFLAEEIFSCRRYPFLLYFFLAKEIFYLFIFLAEEILFLQREWRCQRETWEEMRRSLTAAPGRHRHYHYTLSIISFFIFFHVKCFLEWPVWTNAKPHWLPFFDFFSWVCPQLTQHE